MINSPLVSILSLTYNHEKYIARALDSWLNQQTNFDYEIVLGEDCSTDSTRAIIETYRRKNPEQIRLITSDKNIGPQPNFMRTLKACRGKYIAFCEGDDYWTDPNKLQYQVDFLESHPGYAMISAQVEPVDENGNRLPLNEIIKIQQESIIKSPGFFDLLNLNYVNTLTVCIRADILKEINSRIGRKQQRHIIDYWYWLNVSIEHKLYIWDRVVAAYRIHPGGITRHNELLRKTVNRIRYYSIINYTKAHSPLSNSESAGVVRSMLGMAVNEKRLTPLAVRAVLWPLLHPQITLRAIRARNKKGKPHA